MATFIDSDELLDNIQIAINNAEYYMLHETNLGPVVHAHWVMNKKSPYGYNCSNCGAQSCGQTNYCKDCGAKMDEE